ncbi:hypothetical protein [Thermomonospora umbrina]|uniref:Uncharacterized protein n=1 Tax=Thermomonospora umbrina TaxID=111806 RepID=A0A3D9SRD9_9ACTN|nr:hypothetical protein [Thermomonospora umbrina]REE96513.1 hypothetical protein DFJ69_1950 [Thermomonospora umbrina]
MKTRYFAGWLVDLVRQAADPRVSVQTFAQLGYEDQPLGLVFEYGDGSRLWVQIVGTSPDGGERPDKLTDHPAGLEPAPTTPTGPALAMGELEDLLVGLVEKAGHPDIRTVERYDGRYGFKVVFTDGAGAFLYWLGPSRKGGTAPEGRLYYHDRK